MKLKVLMIAFFVFLILSFPFVFSYPMVASILLMMSSLTLAIGLLIFLSECKTKKVGKIKTEFAHFPMTYVLRAYLKQKNLWVVYDEYKKSFRPADWRDLPIKVILVTLFGMGLLYTSYLIWFTLAQDLSLLLFRAVVMFIFLVIGLYGLLIGLSRLFSLRSKNADSVSKLLNKNKFLRDLVRREKAYVEITPNFLIKDGFVTSVELIVSEKLEIEKLEKNLIEIAKSVEKIK
jgi:hypothetical protein